MINCGNCGAAVEFGEWNGSPAWRCLDNRHHHQPVVKNHLRLPRMRAIVPSRELRQLEKRFETSHSNAQRKTGSQQKDLFNFDAE
jgi:hypothetical protein